MNRLIRLTNRFSGQIVTEELPQQEILWLGYPPFRTVITKGEYAGKTYNFNTREEAIKFHDSIVNILIPKVLYNPSSVLKLVN